MHHAEVKFPTSPSRHRDVPAIFLTNPARSPTRSPPLVRTLRRSPHDPAISEAATACQGRLRNGRDPFPSADPPCDGRRRRIPSPGASFESPRPPSVPRTSRLLGLVALVALPRLRR